MVTTDGDLAIDDDHDANTFDRIECEHFEMYINFHTPHKLGVLTMK